jgi:dephospho-CoA kinase
MYAGKTTLANALAGYPNWYTKVAMAGPLKALAHLAFNEEIVKGKMYPTSFGYKSGRQILQEVGQAMKSVDQDFWLNCFFNDIEHMSQTPNDDRLRFVVDDVRFLFEANALRERGWYVIKVETPEEVRLARGRAALGRDITPEELGHESEVEVGLIIPNFIWDGTTPLEDYDKRVAALLDTIAK